MFVQQFSHHSAIIGVDLREVEQGAPLYETLSSLQVSRYVLTQIPARLRGQHLRVKPVTTKKVRHYVNQ